MLHCMTIRLIHVDQLETLYDMGTKVYLGLFDNYLKTSLVTLSNNPICRVKGQNVSIPQHFQNATSATNYIV